uniref:Progonadoliberin-2 n=1 Tax=Suncus murinus TaxID=9378 RepID=GON2_SUNMU|nr:RecName: Full=Progonadoliberin-2; AltName: Full=Progonadoliberin II; Contains: RecName: Full=Gonadoliberin-2; AltName: Full=Gonadoliberin II; AltName: Full=Gonadotropin-releasing hormone II; Short=GnRH II; AltName: Full=Luliberin II; AltName: Full=Luteinizing hormone-releasing hormone II; Short=LH-RH II; Contains: RecName: Full=GnRH-associated peptide 2; AltName: Full=GnRH-associated peptide II; Flags: Precursor [Suncus murinus]AAD09114.1 preprogonadotropin releasing hormone II [Suncus murinus]
MASIGQGLVLLLLLLLLTAQPGPLKAQHWSHGWYPGGKRSPDSPQDPQPAPRFPEGYWLGLAAGNPRQSTQSLPSKALAPPEDTVSEEAKTMAWWHLQKQRLIQTLLPRP